MGRRPGPPLEGDELAKKLAHIRAQRRKENRAQEKKHKAKRAAKAREREIQKRGQWIFFGMGKKDPFDDEIAEAGLSIISTRQLVAPRFKFKLHGTSTTEKWETEADISRGARKAATGVR
ncbi:MAG TPA: hypothetical protein VMJ93_14655 [Verrucomicrobiae bacterium]|nr:hypothetical protein [Verrucomicrobiae bacterium]